MTDDDLRRHASAWEFAATEIELLAASRWRGRRRLMELRRLCAAVAWGYRRQVPGERRSKALA